MAVKNLLGFQDHHTPNMVTVKNPLFRVHPPNMESASAISCHILHSMETVKNLFMQDHAQIHPG